MKSSSSHLTNSKWNIIFQDVICPSFPRGLSHDVLPMAPGIPLRWVMLSTKRSFSLGWSVAASMLHILALYWSSAIATQAWNLPQETGDANSCTLITEGHSAVRRLSSFTISDACCAIQTGVSPSQQPQTCWGRCPAGVWWMWCGCGFFSQSALKGSKTNNFNCMLQDAFSFLSDFGYSSQWKRYMIYARGESHQ